MSVTSITTESNETFAIPEELQQIGFHKELSKLNVYNLVKNSFKKRHQIRKVWIGLTEEIQKVNIDDYCNMKFDDQNLEEITEKFATTIIIEEKDTLHFNTLQLLEKLIENTQVTREQKLKNISEKFLIEKFTSRNTNANQWVDIFEKECTHFEVKEDEKKIEILKLFMDKSCSDWYSSMIIKLKRDSEWTTWKNKFCETFANKGWIRVTYALLYKYKNSLLDYGSMLV